MVDERKTYCQLYQLSLFVSNMDWQLSSRGNVDEKMEMSSGLIRTVIFFTGLTTLPTMPQAEYTF